jgi:hypothetical protein
LLRRRWSVDVAPLSGDCGEFLVLATRGAMDDVGQCVAMAEKAMPPEQPQGGDGGLSTGAGS